MRYERENPVETYLLEQVQMNEGRCYKWVSPGNPGVMDRIVMFAWMPDQFVETKAPRGRMRAAQYIQSKRLRELGRPVWMLNTKARVDFFIAEMLKAKR